MKKPLIGISGNTLRDTSGAYVDLIRSYVNQDYVRSIEEAGGIPIIIPFTENLEQTKETIDIVDGLLLTGGHDVYPLNYGEEPLRGIGDVFPERDQFDFALLAAAEARNIPVFAICRGCQIVNVYRGGSLYQDLPYDENCTIKHSQNQTPSLPTHTVDIEPDSKLAQIIGTTTWITNSHHHQTCRNIGESLVVTGRAKDGTVEALEDTRSSMVRSNSIPSRNDACEDVHAKTLFKAFVDATKEVN